MLVAFSFHFVIFSENVLLLQLQQASLRIWDEERGQDENSRRDPHTTPNKVIIFSSHLTDASHIEKYLQKDRLTIQIVCSLPTVVKLMNAINSI